MSDSHSAIGTAGLALMADYNRWMNDKMIAGARQLPAEQLFADQGAFFGSVGGTLNHLIVGDLVWLSRFRQHGAGFNALAALDGFPMPTSLSQLLFGDLDVIAERRLALDTCISGFVSEITDDNLGEVLSYQTMAGEAQHKPLGYLLQHLFNHQTHHRGQLTTLFSQAGIEVGTTDLLALIDNV